ncbi:MAG: hypothetical protein V4615_05845 [Bacteroidota bacterium]
MPAGSAIITLQSHLQKSLRKWARNYKRKSETNRFLDDIEADLLFFASFTNLYSASFKEEIHLLANKVFKAEAENPSWAPFYNRIFIKVLDWSVNGFHFDSSSLADEKKIYYKFIALTYAQNNRVRNYSQQMLYCLITKSNWKSEDLLSGVLLSCMQNITSYPERLDYIISMISFLDAAKRIRGGFLVHCIKPRFKDLRSFESYYTGLKLLLYKCENPFFHFYSTLFEKGKETYSSVYHASKKAKLGAQLSFSDTLSGFELIFIKDTTRIEENIVFAKHFVPEANLQKLFDAKQPKPIAEGEANAFIEPPASNNSSV